MVLLLTPRLTLTGRLRVDPLFAEDGMREQRHFSGAEDARCAALPIVTPVMMEPQDVFGAATSVGTRIQKSSQDTTPSAHNAQESKGGKNRKNRSQG